jgi:hypothetical protein
MGGDVRATRAASFRYLFAFAVLLALLAVDAGERAALADYYHCGHYINTGAPGGSDPTPCPPATTAPIIGGGGGNIGGAAGALQNVAPVMNGVLGILQGLQDLSPPSDQPSSESSAQPRNFTCPPGTHPGTISGCLADFASANPPDRRPADNRQLAAEVDCINDLFQAVAALQNQDYDGARQAVFTAQGQCAGKPDRLAEAQQLAMLISQAANDNCYWDANGRNCYPAAGGKKITKAKKRQRPNSGDDNDDTVADDQPDNGQAVTAQPAAAQPPAVQPVSSTDDAWQNYMQSGNASSGGLNNGDLGTPHPGMQGLTPQQGSQGR